MTNACPFLNRQEVILSAFFGRGHGFWVSILPQYFCFNSGSPPLQLSLDESDLDAAMGFLVRHKEGQLTHCKEKSLLSISLPGLSIMEDFAIKRNTF